MLTVAIIPARGGSKRLPHKNILPLNGKPLIAWTIEAALNSHSFDRIIVSTDCPRIQEVAEKYGAEVPYLRSESLATDTATTEVVIQDVVQFLKNNGETVGMVAILQPTSPLRKASHITEAISLFQEKKAKAIVSVCPLDHPYQFCNALNTDLSLLDFIKPENMRRTQDLPTYYRLNGAIYLLNSEVVDDFQGLYRQGSFAYVMPKEDSIDIDDKFDFEFAEFLLKSTRDH
jgi:CMP-N,N'-diacetyllegionaminic acid synthase